MDAPTLSPEIWYLIFQALPSRTDVKNVCAVSRSFEALAAPILYRSITLRDSYPPKSSWYTLPDSENVKDQDEADDLSFGLFCRLLDDRNEGLRLLIHDITVERLKYDHDMKFPPDSFVDLLGKLPNLDNLFLEFESPMTKSFVDALLRHPNSPKVHLLRESGTRQLESELSYVRGLSISVDIHATEPEDSEPFTPQRLALHELFASYPNLESLCVDVNSLRGGCCMDSTPSPTMIIPLSLSSDEKCPPLRSLSLSGYQIHENEVAVWKQKFPWSTLQSLSLGVQFCWGFLGMATGSVQNLKEFKITSYDWDERPTKAELEAFLSSFNTLESLTVKGRHIPSLSAVANHPDLKYLCLHTIENDSKERQTLNVEDIEELDRQCQKLMTLKIDINSKDGWPDDFVKSVATGFKNLRRLSMHVALRIVYAEEASKNEEPWESDTMREIFRSILTESTARDFATRFFDYRGASLLERIELKTGERLRWFPQWPPWYSEEERHCARIFQIYPQKNEQPQLKELESDYARWRRHTKETHRDRCNPHERLLKPRLSRAPRVAHKVSTL